MPEKKTKAKNKNGDTTKNDDAKYQLGFEKLSVWHDANDWLAEMYEYTDALLPGDKGDVIGELRDTALQAMTAIAYAKSRYNRQFQRKTLWYARGKMFQALSMILLVQKLKLLNNKEIKAINDKGRSINRQLRSLIDYYYKQEREKEEKNGGTFNSR